MGHGKEERIRRAGRSLASGNYKARGTEKRSVADRGCGQGKGVTERLGGILGGDGTIACGVIHN